MNSADLKLTLAVTFAGAISGINTAKLAPVLPILIEQFSWTLNVGSWLVAAFSIMLVVGGLLIGALLSAFGARRSLLSALILAFCGGLLVLTSDCQWALWLGRILEGTAFVITMIAGPVLIVLNTQSDSRQTLMGIWGGFLPAGTATALFVGSSVGASADWHTLWFVSTVLSVIAMLCLLRWAPADQQPVRLKPYWVGVRQALRTPVLYSVGAVFAIHSWLFHTVLQFVPYYANSALNQPLVWASLATGIFCSLNVIGNLASGRLMQSGIVPRKLMMGSYALLAPLAMLVFVESLPLSIKLLALICAALLTGVSPPCMFHAVGRSIPNPQSATSFNGLMLQVQGLGLLFGPPIVAAAVTYTGRWESSGVLLLILCIVAIGITAQSKFLKTLH